MEKLKILRKERNISTREMADILSVSKSTYNHWETGRSEPSIFYLKKLADFFCVSIDFLVGASSPIVPGITQRERELLDAFSCLDIYQQDFFLKQIKLTAQEKTLIKK